MYIWCFISWICFIIVNKGDFVNSQWLNANGYGNCEYSATVYQETGEYLIGEDVDKYKDFCLYIRPRSESALTISFLDFSFGYENDNTVGGCVNFLEVSSDEESSSSSVRHCGSRLPPPYFANKGFVRIWVHNEYSVGDVNIRIHYSTVPKCSGKVTITSYTFITFPDFETYQTNYRCEWTVSLHERVSNFPLQLKLSNWSFHKIRPFGLGSTRLRFYDGGKNGALLASFDETTTFTEATTTEVTTTSPTVYISFVSDIISPSQAVFFNVTVKAKGYCVPGTFPCGDSATCYTEEHLCDSQQQCSTGYDELGCGRCPPTEFWCGEEDENQCYTVDQRCNGYKDCTRSMLDEINCKTCGPGSFLCISDSKCIYERWRCDGDFDCVDRSDEDGCTYTASRRVITAAVIGSLICSLLLVVALGCTCKLYSLHASHHRHPHHHYRATPLTRVEREIFQRQAPPTYDMTISGVNTETGNPRAQRNRRRRNRRYQFQRAAPANTGHQFNGDSREEGVESGNPPQTPASPPIQLQAAPSSSQATTSTPIDLHTHTDILQQFGSFLFESMRQTTAPVLNDPATPARTLTPVPVVTRDSGTQTNSVRGEESSPPSSSNVLRTSSSSSTRRSTRSSSGRSRRSSRGSSSSSSKNQQAKPLPKKKRILPVMVPAPCADVAVEEDMLACIYPCPPSYSQALATPSNTDDPLSEPRQDGDSLSSSLDTTNEESQGMPNVGFSPSEEELTVTKSRFFPFSIGRAIRNITSASFSRFQKNPYLQMRPQDSQSIRSQGRTSIDSTVDCHDSFNAPTPTRPSISSDEDMLDCTGERELLEQHGDSETQLSVVTAATMTSPAKVFPERRNVNLLTTNSSLNHFDNNVDMSELPSGNDEGV